MHLFKKTYRQRLKNKDFKIKKAKCKKIGFVQVRKDPIFGSPFAKVLFYITSQFRVRIIQKLRIAIFC